MHRGFCYSICSGQPLYRPNFETWPSAQTKNTSLSNFLYLPIRQFVICAAIVCLFLPGGPAAISWFIVTIVVRIAIKTSSSSTLPHVGKESFKLEPPSAHANTTASIVFPSWITTIRASLNHLSPRLVFWALSTPLRLSMFHILSLS